MKLLFLVFFVSTALLLLNNCDSTDPKLEPELALKLEDVSCTEAWLQLTTNNIQLPATINLFKNNTVTQTFSLSTQDSLLYIDSLLPNQSYKFKVVANTTNNPQPTTNEVLAQTMDTTSHNFTWQTFTFGQHSSSMLYDVAIINENNIWAVGEIYMNDSLGNPDPTFYNSVHWNGNDWKLERIPILLNGTPFYSIIKSIFAFNENDIWFEAGIHWDGITFNQIPFNIQWSGYVNKLWGSSSNDLYAVGNNGSIAHYNGSNWTKIESGTTVSLTDLYGTPDGKKIWTCGWNSNDGHTVLLKIVGSQAQVLFDSFNQTHNPYDNFISSLWTNGKQYFWLTGSSQGVIKHSINNINQTRLEKFALQYFPYRIRGTEVNNIAQAGDASSIWHFNGICWLDYAQLLNINDRIRSMDMKDKILVAVGLRYQSVLGGGLILMGKK